MTQKELDSLIFLLEDPDEEVYANVYEKIISLGDKVIPDLEKTWESEFNSLQQQRIEHLIHKIQFKNVIETFVEWVNAPNPQLSDAVFIINKIQYPSLNTTELQKKIKLIAKDIWLEINNDLTPQEQVNVFNHIFFNIHLFKCIENEKLKTQHYFISDLLQFKSGSNIIIGLLYHIIAETLNLPIQGVCLPDLFVLAVNNNFYSNTVSNVEPKILFYINPVNGKMFARSEITRYLQTSKLKRKPSYYKPSSTKKIVHRYLAEIAHNYSTNDELKYKEVLEMLELLNDSED